MIIKGRDVHLLCSGQFERPRGRLNEEEVPQDLICAENVKNSMENFSFGNDSIISSKRLSDCYEDVLERFVNVKISGRSKCELHFECLNQGSASFLGQGSWEMNKLQTGTCSFSFCI